MSGLFIYFFGFLRQGLVKPRLAVNLLCTRAVFEHTQIPVLFQTELNCIAQAALVLTL